MRKRTPEAVCPGKAVMQVEYTEKTGITVNTSGRRLDIKAELTHPEINDSFSGWGESYVSALRNARTTMNSQFCIPNRCAVEGCWLNRSKNTN